MTNIAIAGEVACASATVEHDAWIPLNVSWWPRAQDQPLYLFLRNDDGLDVEFKVDRETGALVEVVVIGTPPAGWGDVTELGPAYPNGVLTGKRPALDLSMWERPDEEPWDLNRSPVSLSVPEMVLQRGVHRLVLRVSPATPDRWLTCDAVAVGVSASGTLICVVARLS